MDELSKILRPYLAPVTAQLPAQVHEALIQLLGPACHKNLVLDIDLAHSECLKLAVSKALGIAIIGASAIVKLPQLLKLLNSQSARGLSFLSYALETLAYLITLAYNVRHGFPFSTYGETAFIAVQDIAIAVLILIFSGRSAGAAAFVAGLAALVYPLFAGGDATSPASGLVDLQTLGYAQMGAGVLSVASKLPQIWTVWQEGGTGQLSAFAVFNYLAGSLSRIYTTVQEVDDPLILYSFVAGFVLNAVLAAQMVYYWGDTGKKARVPANKRVAATPRKTAAASTSALDTPAAAAGKRTAASTRRRG